MKMKFRRILASTVALGVGLAAMAQEEAFKRAGRLPDVEYIYMSKDILSKVGGSLPVSGMDEVASQLTSMEVLKTSSRESAVKAFDILESSREGMELLTHMSENDGTVDIYGVRNSDKLSELMVLVMNDSILSAVMMKGNIESETIKGISPESGKD